MGYITCKMCDKHLSFNTDELHICDKNQILEKINTLEIKVADAERELDEIRNNIFLLIKEIPSLDSDKIEVSTKFLNNLWEISKSQWGKAENPQDFLSEWLVTHRVLCEAFDLFRSKKYGHAETVLEKLQILRVACRTACEILNYEDDSLDMTPIELVEECRNG